MIYTHDDACVHDLREISNPTIDTPYASDRLGMRMDVPLPAGQLGELLRITD